MKRRKRLRRTGKPGREVGLDVHAYSGVVAELRELRRTHPVDEEKEERLEDQLDVIWFRMGTVDRRQVVWRFGPRRQ